MPKRGGGSGNNSSPSIYKNEHDDRDRRKERNTRRVSFKPSTLQYHGRLGKASVRATEMGARMRLEEDDEMALFKDECNTFRRKGSPIPRGRFGSSYRKLMESSFGWYQVTITNGQRYSKDIVLRELLNALSPSVFIPHYWREEKHCVIFYIDDYELAEKFQNLERNVQMLDGQRLFIRCRGGCPVVNVDEAFKEKMKSVMEKRYNVQNRALDLTKFHADPDFKFVFCGLFRIPVMAACIEIIEKNIPDIVAINLNENLLTTVETLRNLNTRLPQLRILYLGENKIPSLAHLLVLRNVPLTELVLKGNPLRSRFRDDAQYVSEVRRKFPTLQTLDGASVITAAEKNGLLAFRKVFTIDANGLPIVRQFLETYFRIFDSSNRQPLLDAYHKDGLMSISVPPASQAGKMYSFWKYNRNFRRLNSFEDNLKVKQLKIGQLAIVSTLAEWPRTQHDLSSFNVDLTVLTPTLMSFSVRGLFKELEEKSESNNVNSITNIRYFQRVYTIVPNNDGFCISNEMILINKAEDSQVRNFMKSGNEGLILEVEPTAATINSLSTSLQNMTATSTITSGQLQEMEASSSGNVINEDVKAQMIKAMSVQTSMNLEFSHKCLQENNWDYNNAISVFNRLKTENHIPPEAFVQ